MPDALMARYLGHDTASTPAQNPGLMPSDAEIDFLSPTLAIWHRYDAGAKVELFSTSIGTASGTYLVDPISVPKLPGEGEVVGIIVTNANHARASVRFAEQMKLPIFAHAESSAELEGWKAIEIGDGSKLGPDLTIFSIEGAAPGEVALHCTADGGTLIFGDAIINMESQGFTFLPSKYCTNAKLMGRSLRKLLPCRFERMLFAHGTPIVSRAASRFAELVDGQ